MNQATLFALLCLSLVIQSVTAECDASITSPYLNPIGPGYESLPDMSLWKSDFVTQQGKANTEFAVTVPFVQNGAYILSYSIPSCEVDCKKLPNKIASSNQDMTPSRSVDFAFGIGNTCNPDVLRQSSYFSGNSFYAVSFPDAVTLQIKELSRTLQEKLDLKDEKGVNVYSSIKQDGKITLSSVVYVTSILPQGVRPEDTDSTRSKRVKRQEEYILTADISVIPNQWIVLTTSSKVDELDRIYAESRVQAPKSHYIGGCAVTSTQIGTPVSFEVKSLGTPNYMTSVVLPPSQSTVSGNLEYECDEYLCPQNELNNDCKKFDSKARFALSLNQSPTEFKNITTYVSEGSINLYQGSESAPCSVPVNAYTNAYDMVSMVYQQSHLSTDYFAYINQMTLCAEGTCYDVIVNDTIPQNPFTIKTRARYIRGQQMSQLGFPVTSWALAFKQEPYRKISTDFKVTVNMVMRPYPEMRLMVKGNFDKHDEPGVFQFKTVSGNDYNPNIAAIILGVSCGALALLLVTMTVMNVSLIFKLKQKSYQPL